MDVGRGFKLGDDGAHTCIAWPSNSDGRRAKVGVHMNKLISIAGLLALCATLLFAQKKLTPDELEKALETKGGVFFLDVREPDEIQKLGTMPGYVNIPLAQLESRLPLQD